MMSFVHIRELIGNLEIKKEVPEFKLLSGDWVKNECQDKFKMLSSLR